MSAKVRTWGAIAIALMTATASLGAGGSGGTGPTGPGTDPRFPAGSGELAEPGWTPLGLSADSRVIYVSSSQGNDNNDGLSEATPKRTIAAGFALLRDGSPDWLLLKRGDTFYESFPGWNRSGRSATERMVISSYGSGPRPKMLTGLNSAFYKAGAWRGNLVFAGIEFRADQYTGTQGRVEAFVFMSSGDNILIEDCKFENYCSHIIIESGIEGAITNLVIRRNILADAYTYDSYGGVGVYLTNVNGFVIEQNVMDNLGQRIGPDPNVFRGHAIYVVHDCLNGTVRDNIITRVGSIGVLFRPGGIVEGNFIARAAIGVYVAKNPSLVRYNVLTEAVNASSTQPLAIGIQVFQCEDAVVENNILTHCIADNNVNAVALTSDFYNGTGATVVNQYRASFRNNTVFNWAGFRLNGEPYQYSRVDVVNNRFEATNQLRMVEYAPAYMDPWRFGFSNNRYSTPEQTVWNFRLGSGWYRLTEWSSLAEPSAAAGSSNFADPFRSAGTYHASLGGIPTFEGFIWEARAQQRGWWRTEYTAAAINDYIRLGFTPGGCAADVNGDGVFNILDVVSFTQAYASNLSVADRNHDGALNVLDYTTMQQQMAEGCR